MNFSIIVVCLNPGEKLNQTLDSIFAQSCRDYEIIIKDGGSTDGSVDAWLRAWRKRDAEPSETVHLYQEQDTGIYDAMNQAVSHARGDFLLFLNCGDVFADQDVLERTREGIKARAASGADISRMVLYGDTYGEKNQVVIASPPVINGFVCYRNIPCHQSCFYSAALCREKPYDLQYRIRADYDHFLWCYYRAGAQMFHMGFAVASYEGGGYSESRKNRRRDRKEHRLITRSYMGKGELLRYKVIMALTLAPLRRALADSKVFSGVYHRMKERAYSRKG